MTVTSKRESIRRPARSTDPICWSDAVVRTGIPIGTVFIDTERGECSVVGYSPSRGFIVKYGDGTMHRRSITFLRPKSQT
jgi:hypothetical protein